MITGFNTDVEHRGKVFHVQTEEKGPANPVVVTLVYCGGEIVGALESPYAAGEDSIWTRAAIRERMLAQHRARIREIHAGRYDPEPVVVGADRPGERSLDELVLDVLDRSIDEARPPRSRAAHTGRVLERLERMLSAAQRAGASASRAVEPEDPPAPVSERSAVERRGPEPRALEPPPREPARPGRRAPLALAAVIAAAAVTPILLLVGPALPPPAPIELAAALPAAPALELAPPPAEFALEATPVEAPPSAVAVAATTPPASISAPAPAPRARGPRTGASAPRPEPREARSSAPPAPEVPRPEPALAAGPEPESAVPPPPRAEAAPPAERAVETGDLVDLAAVDVRPLVRRRDLPRYTTRARRAGLEGTVELALLIDERGEVADVTLLHDGAGVDLVEESLATARGWTFSPARKDRQPVKVWQQVAIDFTILPNRSTSVRIRE